jgi:hypothetical protein
MTGVEEMATMKAKCRILLSCDVARAAARRRFMMILGYVIGGSLDSANQRAFSLPPIYYIICQRFLSNRGQHLNQQHSDDGIFSWRYSFSGPLFLTVTS